MLHRCFVRIHGDVVDGLDVLDVDLIQAAGEGLRCAEPRKRVAGVIDVSTFAGFVPKAASLEVLAVEEDVSLQVFLRIEKMVVVGGLSFVVIVDDVEDAAHPVRVTRVDQLVRPSVEAAELGLPLREPKHQARYIQIL